MNRQKLLQQVTGVTLVLFILVGCGAPAPGPLSEAPAATPTPAPAPGPSVGFWEGEEEIPLGPAMVSFQIASDGYIRDFTLVMPVEIFACTVNVQEIPINVDGGMELH